MLKDATKINVSLSIEIIFSLMKSGKLVDSITRKKKLGLVAL